jgi:CBS domain-containing protein
MTHQAKVADIMTYEVVSLLEEQNLLIVASNLERFRFHHLPVVDGAKLVGMISQRDLLKNTVAGVDHSAVARAREARVREQTFVRDVMQTDVITASADEPVLEVARRMLQARVGALPVVSPLGELIGIVTENDVLRHVAKHGVEF